MSCVSEWNLSRMCKLEQEFREVMLIVDDSSGIFLR